MDSKDSWTIRKRRPNKWGQKTKGQRKKFKNGDKQLKNYDSNYKKRNC